jgi:hypothetical protein
MPKLRHPLIRTRTAAESFFGPASCCAGVARAVAQFLRRPAPNRATWPTRVRPTLSLPPPTFNPGTLYRRRSPDRFAAASDSPF